jgi:hypothetical protein
LAGSDGGGENGAIVASLIETCKLCGLDPQACLADSIANNCLNRQIEDLPWAYVQPEPLGDLD